MATDNAGNVATTTTPASGAAGWTLANVDGTRTLAAVSCASASLCVADDNDGQVVSSTNPTGGPTAWTANGVDSYNAFHGISCPSVAECVAVDAVGNVVSSTDPTGTTWQTVPIDGTNLINGVSCASESVCVAVDGAGNAISSTTPTGGDGAWKLARIDSGQSLNAVSCPATSLCVAVDNAGNVLTTTDPAAATDNWTIENVDGANALDAVSCPSASFCVAVDAAGNVATSDDPGGAPSHWTIENVDGANELVAMSCPSSSLCVAVDSFGNAVTSTDPQSSSAGWKVANVDGANVPSSISCPETNLCIAADYSGNVAVSTDPTGGSSAWSSTNIDGDNSIFGVSCPSVSFCVAVDASSDAIVGTPFVTLTASLAGAGSGTITSSPGSVNCPTVCISDYVSGTPVTLTVAPAAGSAFAGWSGACSGTEACQIQMNSNQSVTATFVPLRTLKVSLGGTGSGAVSGTGISCPGSCSGQYTDGSIVALTATAAPGSRFDGWVGGGCTVIGACDVTLNGDQGIAAVFDAVATSPATPAGVPANLVVPVISGTPLPAEILTCSNGTWTNNPTSFKYQWSRRGVPVSGANGQTYTVQIADEAQSLTCAVIGSNGTGVGAPASSAGVLVALNGTLKCPAPTGTLHGRALGPLALGMTRNHARSILNQSLLTTNLFDNFCLFGGWGIRVGYSSPNVLAKLPHSDSKVHFGRIVIALTANPFYALDGVRPGTRVAKVKHRLHLGQPFHIGQNTWYFSTGHAATAVLKVRRGVIQEIGIASSNLTAGRTAQNRLLHSFPKELY